MQANFLAPNSVLLDRLKVFNHGVYKISLLIVFWSRAQFVKEYILSARSGVCSEVEVI